MNDESTGKSTLKKTETEGKPNQCIPYPKQLIDQIDS